MSDVASVVGGDSARSLTPCNATLDEFELASVVAGEREFVAQL